MSWIGEVHDACGGINCSARELESLARALDRIGLRDLATEIGHIADALRHHETAIKAACNAELTDSLNNAQQQTAGLLTLALHGVLRPKEDA
jgi:hypothetical protein